MQFSYCSIYRGERYHLKEWGRAPEKWVQTYFIEHATVAVDTDPSHYYNLKAKKLQGTFNLRHSQAQNVIEWIFGVVKWWFQIMVAAPEYSLSKQAKLVNAICVLQNFIQAYDPEDGNDIIAKVEQASPQHLQENFAVEVSTAEWEEVSERQDQIAKAMWEQYIAYNEGI